MMTEQQIRQVVREAVLETMTDEFVTAAQACRILKVAPVTLSRMVKDGRVKARVIGSTTRFLRSDILKSGREKYGRV